MLDASNISIVQRLAAAPLKLLSVPENDTFTSYTQAHTMDYGLIPGFRGSRQLEADTIRKPSKETLKKLNVEITTSDPTDHIYSPGDTISGQFSIQNKSSKPIKDVYFNDVEIKLENRFMTSQGKDATYFTMDDSPALTQFPKMCFDPQKYDFEDCSFPFKFTIPLEHLEDTCVSAISEHRSLLPSYGVPSLCALAFAATSVAGLNPLNSSELQALQGIPNNRFCNTYYISVKVKQNIKGLDRPYVVFTRSLELRVQNSVKSLASQLPQSKSKSLKKGGATAAKISVEAPVPTGLGDVIPLQIHYEPLKEELEFPKLATKFEIAQYSVQSVQCTEPIFTAVASTDQVIVQKLQVLHTGTVQDSETWTPSYYRQGSYTYTVPLKIPHVETTAQTFHSCHLQNIYVLHVEIKFNDEPVVMEKKRWFDVKKKKPVKYEGVSAENVIVLEIPVHVK